MVFKLFKKEINVSILVSIAVIALLLFVAGCAKSTTPTTPPTTANTVQGDQTQQTPPTTPTVEVKTEITANTTKSAEEVHQETLASVIADGSYSDVVSYTSPGGEDSMEVKITVENDVVTSASITAVKAHSVSQKYINGVNAALPELVVGKKISELEIPTQVSGSSLTTAAFKNQVQKLIDTY